MRPRYIGQKLRRYRRQRGLTQHRLAALTGLSVETISRLERGQSRAQMTTARRLAYWLRCETTDLLEREIIRDARLC